MPLTKIPEPELTEAQVAAVEIRQTVRAILDHTQAGLHQIRTAVRGQRSAVAAELGSDASAMLTVYNSLKNAVEVGKSVTIDDLPT